MSIAHASDGDKRRGADGARPGLLSSDPAVAGAAVDALGKRGDRAAVDALAGFLRSGQPDALTDRALLALGATRSPSALSTLAEFARHRRAPARVAAYTGVAGIPGEAANALLGEGLRDSDDAVRGLCARMLAERGAKSQLDLLFRAFARGVPEAAHALGKLADRSALPRFEQELGRLPIQVMLAGYEQFLLRADLDEATKLELIAHLGEVASLTVKRFLEQLLVEHEWARQLRLQRAIADTAKRIDPAPSGAKTVPAGVSPTAPVAPTPAPAEAKP
jgi:HEAT repeat protein